MSEWLIMNGLETLIVKRFLATSMIWTGPFSNMIWFQIIDWFLPNCFCMCLERLSNWIHRDSHHNNEVQNFHFKYHINWIWIHNDFINKHSTFSQFDQIVVFLFFFFWTKWLWFRIWLQSLQFQIMHLFWARSSLTSRQWQSGDLL